MFKKQNAAGSVLAVNGDVAHREVDPNGVVLAMDPVSDVIKQSTNGGLLQGHGGRQAAAYKSRPHFPNTVPISHNGWTSTTMHTEQAVQGTLSNRKTHRI